MWRRVIVDRGGWPLVVHRLGEGPAVVFLPSLGRPVTDFRPIAEILAQFRHAAAAIEFRGIGGSGGPLADLTLDDYVDDVAAVIGALALPPAHLVGAPFGNRVARLLAARRPDLVASATIIGAGGAVPPDAATVAQARRFMAGLASEDKSILAAIARDIYFSPAFRPPPGWLEGAWLAGWSAEALAAERAALHASREPAANPAGRPLLILQGRDDRIAPPENARRLKAELGARASLVEFDDAGHMLLLERPGDVAQAIRVFLERRDQLGSLERSH